MVPERWRRPARCLGAAVAGAVGVFLFLACVQFVQSERGAGGTLAYGVPVWLVQLALPIGFALITLRLLWRASDRWAWRGATVALTIASALR